MNREDAADGPVIPGPYLPPSQSETSPLRQNLLDKKRSIIDFLWNWNINNNQAGSLKSIIVGLFGATGAITLALLTQVYYGEYQIEPHGSVTSDSLECSDIALDVLKHGGGAVDASIASTICLGVVNFHVTGIGGGGYMIVYNHKKRKVIDVIDFREMVPYSYGNTQLDPSIDGLMVGVPGLLKGLWDSHQKHGKLPWEDLIMPSVHLARQGFIVSDSLAAAKSHLKPGSHNEDLKRVFDSIQPGQNLKLISLAATLELIATKGPQVFYNGSLASEIVYSVKVANGNMTEDDISRYETSQGESLYTRFANFDVFVPGSSSGGALLINALNTIQFLELNPDVNHTADTIFKMSDTLHDAYLTFLKQSDTSPTIPIRAASHVSVIDNDENYVSVVSGLNTWLGSQILTIAGFILNDAIANEAINSERRPISLATPIIAVQSDEVCGRRLVLGSGDATIAAQVMTELLLLNKDTFQSIESPRFIIENMPRHIGLENHEPNFGMETISELKLATRQLPAPYTSINVIEKIGDNTTAYSDSRGGGSPAQFR